MRGGGGELVGKNQFLTGPGEPPLLGGATMGWHYLKVRTQESLTIGCWTPSK